LLPPTNTSQYSNRRGQRALAAEAKPGLRLTGTRSSLTGC
jgi:hypothetical protein